MNITFIGNCQMVSLCFYLQQLMSKNNNICWVLYGEDFKQHLNNWSVKCKNKIIYYDESIKIVKNSDIIIYQNIDVKVSNILYNFRDTNLMLTCWHPKTFLFMEVIKILCNLLNFNFFTKKQYNNFLKNENYMELP